MEKETTIRSLPLMALRGITIFPDMSLSFDVERKASIDAIHTASLEGRRIFLVTQKDVLKEEPEESDLYRMGVVCVLRQFVKTPDGMRVMMEGKRRARLISTVRDESCVYGTVEEIDEPKRETLSVRAQALIRNAISLYEKYLEFSGSASPEVLINLTLKNDAGFTADYIAQNTALKFSDKQRVLDTVDSTKRLRTVCGLLAREIEVLGVEKEINEKLCARMMREQRDNVLHEQMKVIQAELGTDEASELEEYRRKIAAQDMPDEVREKLYKETDRLAKQPFGSVEASVMRGYLDTCLELPWSVRTNERTDINEARRILERDHFGLDKVKERIIEFLAVRKLAPDVKGTILCLVGPPGVGKTSIAYSIAKASNRKMARMSLGGVHDEAEIRGHRKTYVGAMPGRIINAVKQAGSRNPLILLDEIDKLGSDHRGDPASALLEALDPEQNTTFRDHYLEVPFDLSEIMFVTTANTTDTIPRALLDRMEVIELSSYTDEEKLRIAKDHLLPKQRKKHGLSGRTLKLNDDVIREMISGWTRESGVRQLEREIAAVCRKAAARIAEGTEKSVTVRPEILDGMLGVRKFKPDMLAGRDGVGLVHGLAWTSAGGELLDVEASVLDGTGKLELTGNLGEVMKESAKTAVSYIRSRAQKLGIDGEFYKNKDIHLHFPEGAVPKDGPSAGIAIAVAVISALTGAPVRGEFAMTGEITLNGRVLAIGGLKEKTMAALRYGIKTVIIPAENEPNLAEIDQSVRAKLNIVTASHVDDVLALIMDIPSRAEDKKKELTEDAFLTAGTHNAPAATVRQ